MLDYNHNSRTVFAKKINDLIDNEIVSSETGKEPRKYLGASQIGHDCLRFIQYGYMNTPRDPGRAIGARTYRIFSMGHDLETVLADYLRRSGFDLRRVDADGKPFSFSQVDGAIKGHADGIIFSGPPNLGLGYPCLWECKTMNHVKFTKTMKQGIHAVSPLYVMQVSLYQAYISQQIQRLDKNPALITVMNKNDCEIYHELMPFDPALAQRGSDRALMVVEATENHELLPRGATKREVIMCRFCDWQDRCWNVE